MTDTPRAVSSLGPGQRDAIWQDKDGDYWRPALGDSWQVSPTAKFWPHVKFEKPQPLFGPFTEVG